MNKYATSNDVRYRKWIPLPKVIALYHQASSWQNALYACSTSGYIFFRLPFCLTRYVSLKRYSWWKGQSHKWIQFLVLSWFLRVGVLGKFTTPWQDELLKYWYKSKCIKIFTYQISWKVIWYRILNFFWTLIFNQKSEQPDPSEASGWHSIWESFANIGRQ
jgi:hypothetical protein